MGALAYDCPNTGETFILIANQVIHDPKLTHNLLSPIQMLMKNQSSSLTSPLSMTMQFCVVGYTSNN
jgi:hypothetical protein